MATKRLFFVDCFKRRATRLVVARSTNSNQRVRTNDVSLPVTCRLSAERIMLSHAQSGDSNPILFKDRLRQNSYIDIIIHGLLVLLPYVITGIQFLKGDKSVFR